MHLVNSMRFTEKNLGIALLAILMLAATLPPAQAARIDVRTLSCNQAVNLARSQGSVVFTLTDTTYDRIVRHRHMCNTHEVAENVTTSTADNPRCLIGKRCVFGDPLFKRGHFWD